MIGAGQVIYEETAPQLKLPYIIIISIFAKKEFNKFKPWYVFLMISFKLILFYEKMYFL